MNDFKLFAKNFIKIVDNNGDTVPFILNPEQEQFINEMGKYNIIKDLEVKGAGFTAKRGTAVRNISLGSEEGQIEGRVNGVKIVILTQFVKKS